MKKIIFLFAILVLCQSSALGQDKYKMVIEKANGSQVVLNLENIVRISIPEIDDNVYLTCPNEDHPHIIDLGLPSKTLWACCNTGSAKPEAYGGYYAWGETEPKHDYKESTYKYYNGEDFIYIGDDISGTQYDAATADWGAPWRIPTHDETLELKANTTSEEVEVNGVKGKKFTGTNGGSIFLPYAGYIGKDGEWGQGKYGNYWSSTLWEGSGPCAFHFLGSAIVIASRENGYTIRAVRSK